MSPEGAQQEQVQAPAKPGARDPRNSANELAGLAAQLAQTLRSDWVRATAEEKPDPSVTEKSTAVCIRYGQRLGELGLATEKAEKLTAGEVESLREASVRDAHSRLARLGSRAAFLLSTQLPSLTESRSRLAERLTANGAHWLEVRGDQPFRWHRFLFYLIPAFLVLGAEGALAEDITRSAFHLKGYLWFLFPIALLSLPLVFKEFLDWKRLNRLHKGYVIAILVLLVLLLLPLSWTRSKEVFGGSRRAPQSAGFDPFASTPGAAPASPQVAPPPRAGSQEKLYLLTGIFSIFGALFPMVSGLCFYRAWEIADRGLEGWRLRKEGKETTRELEAVDSRIGACRTELDAIQQESVKLIASLGAGDQFVEKMIADVVGSLRGVQPEVVANLRRLIEESRDQGRWPDLAKKLALEVEALELPGGALQQIHVKFQKDLLSGIAQIDKGNSLRSLADALKQRVHAALSEGHQVGTKAPALSSEEMVELMRQRRLQDALFGNRRRDGWKPAA